MKLASSAFEESGPIPKQFGYKHGNKLPQLSISDVPAEAKSLALIMDDPDAQQAVGKVWVHWLLWNIDPSTSDMQDEPAGSVSGTSDFGQTGYGGPAPPDRRHTYFFRLYALDARLDLESGSDRAKLEQAIKGKILAEATLTGTYEPDA